MFIKSLCIRLFVLIQFCLPKHLLTLLAYKIARIKQKSIKNFLIIQFIKFYGVNTHEIVEEIPDGFTTFNAFFTRTINHAFRHIDGSKKILISPSDGEISSIGKINGDQLFQAKGKNYGLHDLLMTNIDEAEKFINGSFVTIYLAPENYHRVHAPMDGKLITLKYFPGNLFSVNNETISVIPKLFIRNERLLLQFQTEIGSVILILVGALNVGSITTPWTGELRPRRNGAIEEILLPKDSHQNIKKGDLLGWFNLGSTVILLLPPDTCELKSITKGDKIFMGTAIGELITFKN